VARKFNIPKTKKSDRVNFNLPETKEDWITYVNRLYDHGMEIRKPHEFQWVVNYAYYSGYQNLSVDLRTFTIRVNDKARIPISINRIAPFIESRQAKLTKRSPVPRVAPDTNDFSDVKGAQAADLALMHIHRKINMAGQYDQLTMHKLITGLGYIRTGWDPFEGDVLEEENINENDELVVNEQGETTKKIWEGEVSSRFKSAFSVLVPLVNVPEIRDQPWVMERDFMPAIDVIQEFPDLKGKLKKEDIREAKSHYERLIDKINSPPNKGGMGFGTTNDDTGPDDPFNTEVLVKTLWIKPNAIYENGLIVKVIGDQLAMLEEWPESYGERNIYPIVKFTEKEDGKSYFPQSTVERLIPVQRTFNRMRDQVIQNAQTMANIKWMVPKGTQISQGALDDTEAEIVEYNANAGEPHAAKVSPLPNYVAQLQDNLIMDFRDVGGQRESSVTPPPNITAGVAMEVAAELSDEILGPIIKRYARNMETVAQQHLYIASKYWVEQRKVKILGDDNVMGVQWLSGVDFKNQVDVHIEVDSMFPEFRGSQRQFILDMWDRRIEQDPTIVKRALATGRVDVLYKNDMRMDEQIQLDIIGIKKGRAPQVHAMQNHMEYVKKLSQWVQTPEFLKLIPERKELALGVLQEHIKFIVPTQPGGGQEQPQQNQNSVGTPFGPTVPDGA